MNCRARIYNLMALALLGASANACHRDASANQVAQQQDHAPMSPSGQRAEESAKSQYDEAPFSLSISAPSGAQKGQAADVTVLLAAKAPYHVNPEYPHRFKVTTSQGITTPSSSIKVEPTKITQGQLQLVIPATLGQTAPYVLAGELSFSLCTDERCLMEKRQLAITIAAH